MRQPFYFYQLFIINFQLFTSSYDILFYTYIILVGIPSKLTREFINTYFKLMNTLFNIIYYGQHLFQKKTTMGFLHMAINLFAKPNISILEQSFFLQYIFLKYLNSNLGTIVKADYIKQLFKIKYIYEEFKKEYDLFYFSVIFEQISQFLSQYDKIS